MEKIIFVCTGNTCRSPMAMAYAKTIIKEYDIISRGIMVFAKQAPNSLALQVAQNNNVDLSYHSSENFSNKDLKNTKIVLTMTESHKNALLSKFKELDGKIFTLKEASGFADYNILDPFAGSLADYEFAFAEIKKSIDIWVFDNEIK